MVEAITFLVSAVIILGGALGVLFGKNPVRAALSLVASFFAVAVLFVIPEAHFLAFVQVVVYGGAIVVLFLFVIMLLGVDKLEKVEIQPLAGQTMFGYLAGFGFFALVITGLFLSGASGAENAAEGAGALAMTGTSGINPITDDSNISQLAGDIFARNLLAFEATGLLLTIATIGAVAMVKNSEDENASQDGEVVS